MIALLVAMLGTAKIHVPMVLKGGQKTVNRGAFEMSISRPETRTMLASMFLALNALKAAEAMKKAMMLYIVPLSG